MSYKLRSSFSIQISCNGKLDILANVLFVRVVALHNNIVLT